MCLSCHISNIFRSPATTSRWGVQYVLTINSGHNFKFKTVTGYSSVLNKCMTAPRSNNFYCTSYIVLCGHTKTYAILCNPVQELCKQYYHWKANKVKQEVTIQLCGMFCGCRLWWLCWTHEMFLCFPTVIFKQKQYLLQDCYCTGVTIIVSTQCSWLYTRDNKDEFN